MASTSLIERARILLGISAYQPPPKPGLSLDDPNVERTRQSLGGQIALPTYSQTRWYLADLETAELAADAGQLAGAARLMREARKDGVFGGVLSTRTGGLVRLPKRFRGDPDLVAELELGHDMPRSRFDDFLPPQELALLAADGITLGVGVAEIIPVEGREFGVLTRLDPEYLLYIWSENRWYYRSALGLIGITPGDGRWVLHVPGGRFAPWQHGLWRAIGRSYIRKDHAQLYKDNWEAKLANSARVAISPAGATDSMSQAWFRAVMAWGVNTVFSLRPGFDIRLVESNGRGYESFLKTIADQNQEMVIAVAGQTVTTDGGTGFANADIHKSIRADLIKETADNLAFTINTQALPVYVLQCHGEDALSEGGVVMEWDVTPPKDRAAEAQAMSTAATAIQQLAGALQAYGMQLDIDAMAARFGIPLAAQAPTAIGEATEDASDSLASGGTDNAADAALNGAQIASMVDVVRAVVSGEIPRDAAIAIIMRSFLVDQSAAEDILGTAGLDPVDPPDSPDLDADADADAYADAEPIAEAA